MPLRINTGTLSDLIQRQGAQKAAFEAQQWGGPFQAAMQTIGAYNTEIDREREEIRRQHQDEYYETMRQETQREIDRDERAQQVTDLVDDQSREFGHDPVSLSEWGLNHEDADVTEFVRDRVLRAEADRQTTLQQESDTLVGQEAAMGRVTQQLDDWIAAGDGAAYLSQRPALLEQGRNLQIEESVLQRYFPPTWNVEALARTANIGRDEAAKSARVRAAVEARRRAVGSTLPTDAVARAASIRDHRKAFLATLDIDPDNMNQGMLDAMFADASGDEVPTMEQLTGQIETMGVARFEESMESQNPRRTPKEVLEGYEDLRTFGPGWREKFEAAKGDVFTADDRSLDQQIAAAIASNDMPRYRGLLAFKRESSEAGRAPRGADAEAGRIETAELGDLRGEVAEIENRVWTGLPGLQPYRLTDGQWRSFTGRAGEYEDAAEMPEENQRWLTRAQGDAAIKRLTDGFRRDEGLLTREEEDSFLRRIQENINAGGIEAMERWNFKGKRAWLQAHEDAGDDAVNPRIDRRTLVQYALDLTKEEFEQIFGSRSRFARSDWRKSLQTFRDLEWGR